MVALPRLSMQSQIDGTALMVRSSRVLLVSAIVSLLLSSLLFPRIVLGQAKVDLDTIRDAVEFYTSNVKTLELTYTTRKTAAEGREDFLPNRLGYRDLGATHKLAADLGYNRTAIETHKEWVFESVSDRPFNSREFQAYDGEWGWQLTYTPAAVPVESNAPKDVPHSLNHHKRDETSVPFTPLELAGLRLRSIGGTVRDLLRRPGVRLVGLERVESADCYRLEGEHQGMRVVVCLDPDHGYLPRRQEFSRPNAQEGASDRFRVEVFEFQRFPNPDQPEPLWFPTLGRVWAWNRQYTEIKVSEVALNAPLELSRFRVDVSALPDGVEIFGSEPTRYTNGRRDLWQARHDQLEAQKAALMKLAPPPDDQTQQAVSATPPLTSRWLPWSVGIVSFAVLTAGVGLILRSKRQSKRNSDI